MTYPLSSQSQFSSLLVSRSNPKFYFLPFYHSRLSSTPIAHLCTAVYQSICMSICSMSIFMSSKLSFVSHFFSSYFFS